MSIFDGNALACDPGFIRSLELFEGLHCKTLAFMLMPDHVHWLVTLEADEALSDIVRLYKGRMAPVLREHDLRWQKGAYHDRRLRPDDELAPFLSYMLCNPYRAGVCRISEVWPFWYCDAEILNWFEPTTDARQPHPEWIAEHRSKPWDENNESQQT